MVIGLILFAILGLTMGYTIPGWGAWLALAVPVAFALITALITGLDSGQIVVLAVALGVTAAAVLAGRLLDRTLSGGGEQAS